MKNAGHAVEALGVKQSDQSAKDADDPEPPNCTALVSW